MLTELAFTAVEASPQIARDILFRTIKGGYSTESLTHHGSCLHAFFLATFVADRFCHPPSYTICDAVVSAPTISQPVCMQFFSHLTTFLSLSPPHTSGKAHATYVSFLAQSLLLSLLLPLLLPLLSPPAHTAVFGAMTQQQHWTFASLPPHTLALYSMVHMFLHSVYSGHHHHCLQLHRYLSTWTAVMQSRLFSSSQTGSRYSVLPATQ